MKQYLTSNLPKLIGLREACEILHVHPNTLRLWDKRGILKAIRIGPRGDRNYNLDQVLTLINQSSGTELDQETNKLLGSTRVEQALERLNRIQTFSTTLSKPLSPPDIIEVITSQITQAVGGQYSIVMEIDQTNHELKLLGFSGYKSKLMNSLKRVSLDTHISLTD